jgi:hypothetical protein
MVALILNIAMTKASRRLVEGMRKMRDDTLLFPKLSCETILFVAADCAGTVMGNALPREWVEHIRQALGRLPPLESAFLCLASWQWRSPASAKFPQMLVLPPLPDLTAIITGCDLSSSLTPFSALSLTANRYSENSVSNQHW